MPKAPKPVTEKTLFLVHCKLTCLGGSSQGECDCKSPNDCELRHDRRFSYWRNYAQERMMRYAKNGLESE